MIIPVRIPERMVVKRIALRRVGRDDCPDTLLYAIDFHNPIFIAQGALVMLEAEGEVIPIEDLPPLEGDR